MGQPREKSSTSKTKEFISGAGGGLCRSCLWLSSAGWRFLRALAWPWQGLIEKGAEMCSCLLGSPNLCCPGFCYLTRATEVLSCIAMVSVGAGMKALLTPSPGQLSSLRAPGTLGCAWSDNGKRFSSSLSPCLPCKAMLVTCCWWLAAGPAPGGLGPELQPFRRLHWGHQRAVPVT